MKINSQVEKELMLILFKVVSKLQIANIICDKTGKVLFANEAYKALAQKNSIGQIFWKIFPLTNTVPNYFREVTEQEIETRTEITVNNMIFITRVCPISDILV